MTERPDINDQARNKWRSILNMLGIDQSYLRNVHGPCPLCDGTDRFRFDDKEGRGSWICNQCGAGNGMDLAMKFTRMSFAECAAAIRERLGEAVERKPRPAVDPEAARRACNDLWQGSVPILDDDAAVYLRSRRLTGPFSSNLRFHPAAEVFGHPSRRTLPAMLARVTGHDGKGLTLHRTYLEGGRKARWTRPGDTLEASCRKLMPGPDLPNDAAIRLAPHKGVLAVAEGIETALAVTRDFGLPCWSLLNTSMMAKWNAPDDVRELHIFGDNDPKFGGQQAAFALAHRMAVKPNGPLVHPPQFPSEVGTDWADEQQKMEAA